MSVLGNAEIVLIYIVGTFGMIILAGAIFFFFVTYQKRLLIKELEINRIKSEQQEEMLKNTINAQEKERKRIARDLHDEVGAMLSVVKLNINRFEKKSGHADSKELAQETKTYIDEVITQVRRISRDLMPPSLEKLGLYFALEDLTAWIKKAGQIDLEIWKSGEPFRFDVKKELAVFRIIQELLNNSIKHSRASKIEINIRFTSKGMAVFVRDNGVGFELKKMVKTGLGLQNLESRAQIIGAGFKMKSRPGKGTMAILYLQTIS